MSFLQILATGTAPLHTRAVAGQAQEFGGARVWGAFSLFVYYCQPEVNSLRKLTRISQLILRLRHIRIRNCLALKLTPHLIVDFPEADLSRGALLADDLNNPRYLNGIARRNLPCAPIAGPGAQVRESFAS